MKTIDKMLRMVGLMRISQQPVRSLEITNGGRIRLELRNGFRWSGIQDRFDVASQHALSVLDVLKPEEKTR